MVSIVNWRFELLCGERDLSKLEDCLKKVDEIPDDCYYALGSWPAGMEVLLKVSLLASWHL